MSDQLDKTPPSPNSEDGPTILRNEQGEAVDPTVVVDEANRTVLLTQNETIVIEKQPEIDLPPKNRPRKVYGGMWGPVEIGVLGAGLLAVLAAILLYVFFVVPSNREIEAKRAQKEKLEAEMISAREKYGRLESDENHIAKLISSVNDFEAMSLPNPVNGRTALYQRLNGLIASYGLVNSSGPDYQPLEIVEKGKEENEEKSGKSKFRTFFPGVFVSMTVEGPYVNLRRFLREIETGNEFVVINSVELEPSDAEQDKPAGTTQAGMPGGGDPTTMYPAGMPSNPMRGQPVGQAPLPDSSRGKTHGSVVSLKIELAAYFRRPSSMPVETGAVQQ